MASETSRQHVKSTRRGLATIAFLKARFDEGIDYLGMFQPLVEEEIRHYEKDDIDLGGFQAAVRASTGLAVPTDILRTLLRRATRKKLLTRQGGRFLRQPGVSGDASLARRMKEIGSQHLHLAKRLRESAEARGIQFSSDDDALAALMRFLDENHIGVVLGHPIQGGPIDGSVRLNHAVAAFVADILRSGDRLGATLEDIVKGLIVRNALILRDIPIVKRHLEGLTVFLDTGVLLQAMGYAGPAEEQATVEGIRAVRKAGAQLYAFEQTIDEVESILRVYERKLGSTAGIRSLHTTPLTFHFLEIKSTPADIRQEIAFLRNKLAQLRIRTREFPKHIPKYTEDEAALAEALKDRRKQRGTGEKRVWHDVRAVSAIVTLRAGNRPNKIASARFIFASRSSLTVLNVTRWYRESYRRGLEPIVHFRSVTNAAWVLSPVNAASIPMKELFSVCSAILHPSAEVWSRFVWHLERLVTSGELGDDESVAVLAHQFTRIDLTDIESEEDLEATTVSEIVERVRESQAGKFRTQLAVKQSEVDASKLEAADAQSELKFLKSKARAQTERVATWIAGTIHIFLCLILAVGAILTLPIQWSDWSESNSFLTLVLWLCATAFPVVSLLGFFSRRFHMLNIFDWLKMLVASRIENVGSTGKSPEH